MTYAVNSRTYVLAPYFLWQEPRPQLHYNHPLMRDFYERELHGYEEMRTLVGLLRHRGIEIAWVWSFYFGPALTIPLFALPWVMRDRRMRFPLAAVAGFL